VPEPAVLTSAVDAELLLNTRRANVIRLGAVGFFTLLFVGLGEVLGDDRWKTDLRALSAYFGLALLAWLVGRRSDRLAPITALAPAVVDLPFIYLVQRAQFPTTPSKPAVAGFTLGILITLLISGMLTMRRWQLVLTCAVAAALEVALQWEAGVSAGAMISAVAVIGVATLLFTYAGSRVQALLVKTSHQEKLASLGQLSAAVGHDLRSPLAAISTSVFVVRREAEKQAPPPEKLLKALGLIERESAACARIVTDLLDYTQERPLELAPVALPALVGECAELVRKRPNVALKVELPPDLPELTLARDRVRQVLMNLIQNAIEAVPDGRPGNVTVSAKLEASTLTLAVADDGVGLPPEVKARIFEPLFTTKKDGTGLGLAIVDTLVKQQGGKLEVASTVGVGSTFSVRLPR
jgi:signal transduction histidine kinase